ncbi:flagellar hook-length control protein FliK [Pseudomonas sp. 273]|uniref:flagellar hook-length control protein FliK n=1 Tax=Pseudomonas sp. 273 TaxID=75692 RepID=UPI0023D84654|nr:flagellar hook-length control protein FliK [Pseudomonas sp. 273]
MLQVNTRLAADAAPGKDTPLPAVPAMGAGQQAAGTAARGGSEAAGEVLPAFAAQLAKGAEATEDVPEAPSTPADPAAPQDLPPQPDPSLGALPGAEQWLASMLGQREVTLQARDAGQAGDAASAPVSRALPGNLPLPQLPQGMAEAPPPPAQGQPLPSLALPAKTEEAPPAKAATAADELLHSQLDKLAGQVPSPAAPAPPNAPAVVNDAQPLAASHMPERQLSLQAPAERWGEQLLNALRDNVELQLRHNQQSAAIRLDPPELGRLEIYLSRDNAGLTVQIHAAQGDVARLLQQGAERLRQDIAGASQQPVEVQVSDGRAGQQQAQQQQARQGRPASWLDDAPTGAAAEQGTAADAGLRPRDVLVTV